MKITVEIPIEQTPLPDFEAVTVKQITVDVPDKDIVRIVERYSELTKARFSNGN